MNFYQLPEINNDFFLASDFFIFLCKQKKKTRLKQATWEKLLELVLIVLNCCIYKLYVQLLFTEITSKTRNIRVTRLAFHACFVELIKKISKIYRKVWEKVTIVFFLLNLLLKKRMKNDRQYLDEFTVTIEKKSKMLIVVFLFNLT